MLKKEQLFYVKPIETMPPILPEDVIYKIKVSDINSLALLALELNNDYKEIKEAYGYANALDGFIQRGNPHSLSDTYFQLTSNTNGKEILCINIELCLLEKKHREKGITMDDVRNFNEVCSRYIKALDFNAEEFSQEAISEKEFKHR